MKKFLIILCCVSLLLPAAALSAFAEDSYNLRCYNYVNSAVTVTFTSGDSSSSLSFNSGWGNYNVPYGVVGVSCGRVIANSSNIALSTDPSNPSELSFIDGHYMLSIQSSLSSSTYYYYIPVPPDPFGELGVNDGVDSSISYTGQLIHFLTTNTTTVVLIGLSVAVCAVLPFAIRKIKQIIKGY